MHKISNAVSGALAAAALAFAGTGATAGVASPPVDHAGQWWTNPIGCEYSRAGRPGETIWFLILNTAKAGCPTYIATVSPDNVYGAHGPLMGKRQQVHAKSRAKR